MHSANELYHYGKLGMKWGVRRYQNKYGGLNQAGRTKVKQLVSQHDQLSRIARPSKKGVTRISELEKQYSHLTGRLISDHPARPKKTTKQVSEMTNEELTAYNTRKQLEATYQGFQPKQQASKGKQFVQVVMKKVVEPAAIDVGKKYIINTASAKLNIPAGTLVKAAKETGKVTNDAAKAATKATEKANDKEKEKSTAVSR